jgi:hypothetical protein
MYFKPIAYFILIISLATGCKKASLFPVDYIRYVERPSNGLRIEKSMANVKYWAQYKSNEYILLKESRIASGNSKDFTEGIKVLSGFIYFTFNIGSSDGKRPLIELKDNKSEYFQRLAYCNSGLQNDFLLVDGEDTLPCAMYQFERNYGLAPSNNFILGFKQKNSSTVKDKTLLYFDHLFNFGLLKFSLKASDINQIPELKSF